MKTIVIIMSVVGLCAAAHAAPFHVLSYEAGGGIPGVAGMGYSVDFGGFFTADGAGDNVFVGRAANYTTANEQEFDSRFSLDGFGPSARNRSIIAGNNSTTTLSFYGDYGPAGSAEANYDELEGTEHYIFGPFNDGGASYFGAPGSHIGSPFGGPLNPENIARAGVGVAPPPVQSHYAPNVGGGRSPHDGVFVGRFTIKVGATLSGGILLNTLVSIGVVDSHELILGGPSVLFETSNGPQYLSLRAYRVNAAELFLDNPTFAGGDGESSFGFAQVLDLWVQVPGPGAAVLAMLTTLTIAGRRRRSRGFGSRAA